MRATTVDQTASICSGESRANVLRVFDFIDHRDGKILHRDHASIFRLPNDDTRAHSERPGALAEPHLQRRGDECPADVLDRTQVFEREPVPDLCVPRGPSGMSSGSTNGTPGDSSSVVLPPPTTIIRGASSPNERSAVTSASAPCRGTLSRGSSESGFAPPTALMTASCPLTSLARSAESRMSPVAMESRSCVRVMLSGLRPMPVT